MIQTVDIEVMCLSSDEEISLLTITTLSAADKETSPLTI